jgi:pimeloyl-ACP methyl ester carboxylesterase
MNRRLANVTRGACALLLVFGPWASTQASVECTPAGMQAVSPANTTILSATPESDPVAHCALAGFVTTVHPGPNQVNFALSLPATGNGRFLFIGNGGFGGDFNFPEVFPDFESIPDLTRAGFAIAFTDTGHQGGFLDGRWALNDQAKQEDYLFRGVYVTAVAAKAITKRFYGIQPRAYFAGCSDGGREGLVEAQRYPGDFDGIIAGDPAIGPVAPGFNWNQEHLAADAASYIPPDKLALIDAALMQRCDAADGVADGLIQDPRKCKFDPATLLCSAKNSPNCLSAPQVAALKAVYAGATAADGESIYPGFTASDPAVDDSWSTWITGFVPPDAPGTPEPWTDPTLAPWQFLLEDQILRFFVFADPGYDSFSFNLNSSDLIKTHMVMNRGGGEGTNPDLSAFESKGGKLILYHGWSDPAVSPLETIRYYKSVIQDQGSFSSTERSARLFMVPGMQHCVGTGPGPNIFDPLPSLIDWVEKNVEPKQIIAAHFQNNDPSMGVITRTMPLCSYPKAAVFTGGDVSQAANWSCRAPE